jgi:hypothetical protein
MGIYWEPIGNLKRTWKEHVENKRKMKKNPLSHPQIQKKIKSRHF